MALARAAVRRSRDGWDLGGADPVLLEAIEIERPAWWEKEDCR